MPHSITLHYIYLLTYLLKFPSRPSAKSLLHTATIKRPRHWEKRRSMAHNNGDLYIDWRGQCCLWTAAGSLQAAWRRDTPHLHQRQLTSVPVKHTRLITLPRRIMWRFIHLSSSSRACPELESRGIKEVLPVFSILSVFRCWDEVIFDNIWVDVSSPWAALGLTLWVL